MRSARRGDPRDYIEEKKSRSGLFVAAVEAIYSTAAQPDKWPNALEAIAGVFGDTAANLIWRRNDGSFGTVTSPALQAAQREYEAGWWRQDIRAVRALEYAYRTSTGVVTDRHVVTSEEINTHPFFTDFLARHGLKWVASIQISPDPHIMVGLTVHRGPERHPYSDEELEVLSRLGRHAEHALRLGVRLLDAEATRDGLADALNRIGIGALILDSMRKVIFANQIAKQLLEESPFIGDGELSISDRSIRAALDTAVRKAIAEPIENLTDEPRPIAISRHAARRPLVLYVLPIRAATEVAYDFLRNARAVVLVIDSEEKGIADPALVRDALGITLGEARIASLIGYGLAPRDAAERLGISEETARTSLKRVFGKTGVSRQSELAALLAKLTMR